MKQILWIDACVREESRTRKERIPPLTGTMLTYRSSKAEKQDFSDPVFRYAMQLKDADEILISAPYWDLSFPASLKSYIEAVNIVGLTFRYTEDNQPVSMIRAKRLIYVTTAGGGILSEEPGFGYIRLVMNSFYGINDFLYFKTENLDLFGADPESILKKSREEIDRTFLEER